MVLGTTGMRKGVDAMAGAWSQQNGVNTILFVPDQRHGNRAPFLRNESIVKLNPVEAIIGEGSGIQSNLAQRLRQAGVPLHIRRISDQAQVRSRNLLNTAAGGALEGAVVPGNPFGPEPVRTQDGAVHPQSAEIKQVIQDNRRAWLNATQPLSLPSFDEWRLARGV